MKVSMIALGAALLLAGRPALSHANAGKAETAAQTAQSEGPAADAGTQNPRSFLLNALDTMKENAWHASLIDWEKVRAAALAQSAGARDLVDTFPAIRAAIAHLSALDWHAHLRLSPELKAEDEKRHGPEADTDKRESAFEGRRAEARLHEVDGRKFGQIIVPKINGAPGPALDQKAVGLEGLVAGVHAQRPCGWVVDVRGNTGGNMWPMIAGLNRLLGATEFGGFINRNGQRTSWFQRGAAFGTRRWDGTERIFTTLSKGERRDGFNEPIALLFDRATASSGEATAIALLGRPNTRSFGTRSASATTSPKSFDIGGGAQLFLGTSVYQDRSGRLYPTGLTPDEVVEADGTAAGDDPALRRALQWLAAQPNCSGAPRQGERAP